MILRHSPCAALVLAAGLGKRMQSAQSKVLHPCGGLPLICHVVRRVLAQGCDPVVVVVSPATHAPVQALLARHFAAHLVRYAVQPHARGTGDAAQCGMRDVPPSCAQVVIVYGDVPLLRDETLARLKQTARGVGLAVLTAVVADPCGYGRIVRDARGRVSGVVEDRDATAEQKQICEVNAGIYWVDAAVLRAGLAKLQPQNAQNELYLTDIVAHAAVAGGAEVVALADPDEMRGVNSRADLAAAEAILRRRLVALHQAGGVTFLDPDHVRIGVDVTMGRDVTVGPGVQLLGATHLADGASVDGPTVVIDSEVGTGAHVRHFCHLEGASIGAEAQVGPFARLRPMARLDEAARVGNFVEVKKATLKRGAKVNHLSYVGDADIGAGANLGAGTITCNYDGYGKHRTVVGARAFVGSNAALVAPVTIGEGATVAAGSCITDDVPADALAFGRARQVNRDGAAATLRQRLAQVHAKHSKHAPKG